MTILPCDANEKGVLGYPLKQQPMAFPILGLFRIMRERDELWLARRSVLSIGHLAVGTGGAAAGAARPHPPRFASPTGPVGGVSR